MLKELYSKCLSQKGCKNVYCTTCGGLARKADSMQPDMRQIKDDLINIEGLGLTQTDFHTPRWHAYPRGRTISEYLEFIIYFFERLSDEEKEEIVNCWIPKEAEFEDILVDGIGYYVTPRFLKRKWLPILERRAGHSASIQETIKLRYRV